MLNKSKFKKRMIIFSLIFIFVLSFLFSYDTLAKYISNLSNLSLVSVAKPVLVYDGINNNDDVSLNINLDDINPKSGTKTYSFDIINEKDVVSEVDIDYILTVTSSNNLPLNISVICDNAITTNNTINATMDGVNQSIIYNGSFKHSVKEVHSYIVNITWQDNANSYLYAGEVDKLNISVEWVQVGDKE